MAKKLYDMRGKQANLVREARFDMEGFVHMLFFRALIFLAIIDGVVILAYLALGSPAAYQLGPEALTAAVWVLITPQLFESIKLVSMMRTRGLAFGHFSKDHAFLMRSKYRINTGPARALPYAVMAVWAAGFVAMVLWWSI